MLGFRETLNRELNGVLIVDNNKANIRRFSTCANITSRFKKWDGK